MNEEVNEEVNTNPLESTLTEQADFDLEDEFEPPVLVQTGVYAGTIEKLDYNFEGACLVWTVKLEGNGGNCVTKGDGGIYVAVENSPVDNQRLWFRNWLPRPGDEAKISQKTGKSKKQWKVNALGEFCNALDIPFAVLKNPAAINGYIDSLDWKGLEVTMNVEIEMSDKYGDKSVIKKMSLKKG